MTNPNDRFSVGRFSVGRFSVNRFSVNRFSPWRLENTLAAGFFVIILLGLLGYSWTVQAMQASARRTHRVETQVNSCVSLAKDVTLHSHDTSFFTLSYVYTGNLGDSDQKWAEQESTRAGFNSLNAQLKLLPGSAALQAQCAAAERQNKEVCEPQELLEMRLASRGRRPQAQDLLQTEGTAGRDNLEIQLDDLAGINPTQDPDAAPRGLSAYRLKAQAAEARVNHRMLVIGEALQAAILLFSLLIAVAVIRSVSANIRAVLHAQEDLHQSEARYRILFEGNPHPIWVFDQASLRFLAVNTAALRSYGYTREQFLSMKYGDFRAAGEVPAFDFSEGKLVTETLVGERRHQKKDGSVIWVEVVLHPLMWQGCTACMAVVQDITTRREAETSVNRLAAIVNSSHDSIVGWNAAKQITSWNPGAERLYGWTEKEMLGRSVSELVPDECWEETQSICANLKAGQSIELPDTLRLHKEGHRLEVWVSTSPIVDASGVVVGASTITRDISEQKKTQALVRWQAYNDPLTCLPNRACFQQALEDAIARARPFSVLFVDLNQFKHVNDSLGHAAGDHLLQEVTARFERCLERGNLLARMGGDEFTLLLEEDARPDEKAEALLHSLFQPVFIEGHELHVAASIGLSRFPDHAGDAETLLKCADLALYRAKESGRGQWQEFSPVLTEAARERLTLESSLRKAIERDELILLYQPQVSLETGEVIGSEALVRWMHPEMGLISPARFIPLAEETGLIVPLGEWVLRTACHQAAQWERAGTPLRQAVNVSARQLSERGLVQAVQSILTETGLSPHLLDLELTESTLVAQGEAAAACLPALRALGVRVSLDDFGTGYSSLAYLRRFPLDVLKVDRSFVQGLTAEELNERPRDARQNKEARQDQAVVQAIIDMAHALDLEVVAEGVETVAQRETLRHLDCDTMQGFLFSPPVTPERLESLLPQHCRKSFVETQQAEVQAA